MFTVTHAFNSTFLTPFTPIGWTQVPAENVPFSVSNINSIAYGENIFVSVGDSGKLATASTFNSWTSRTSSFGTSKIFSVAYGAGIFVAVGSSGKLATSSDGINWTQRASGFGAAAITSVSYFEANNIWIAVASDGKLGTSPDGISWTLRLSPFGTTYINKIYTDDNLAVAVGYDGKLATSSSGTSWVVRTSGFSLEAIFDVTSNIEFKYVAVGELGKVAISQGGQVWVSSYPFTSFGSSTIRTVDAVKTQDGAFLAAGASGKLATSFDGITWDQRVSSFGSSSINDLYLTNTFGLAVGNSGKIAYSN